MSLVVLFTCYNLSITIYIYNLSTTIYIYNLSTTIYIYNLSTPYYTPNIFQYEKQRGPVHKKSSTDNASSNDH